jgi:hypothetical protein
MAKYIQGINGIFIGKVGTVVGCVWKGIPYMRSIGNPRTGAATPGEVRNRSKFSTVHYWLHPLLVFLRAGFADYSERTVGFNGAKSYNLRNAISEGLLLPELVQVSHGDLPLSAEMTVTFQDDRLHFNWSTDSIENSSSKDQIMVLAYHPESSTAIYEMHGAFRSMGNQILDTYKQFLGQTIHVYAAFIAADRTRQSNSVYLGAMQSKITK